MNCSTGSSIKGEHYFPRPVLELFQSSRVSESIGIIVSQVFSGQCRGATDMIVQSIRQEEHFSTFLSDSTLQNDKIVYCPLFDREFSLMI
jgi:hypothetical protein